MMKNKLFAPFLMLVAAALASIIMFRGNYNTTELLLILLCVMFFFYILGCFIQNKVISFMNQILEKEAEEEKERGEVIEKDAAAQENANGETAGDEGVVKENPVKDGNAKE